jgi:endonuclease YncB( thermonuclease family)
MEHLKLSCRVGIGLRAILAAVGISVAAAASADEIIGLARVVDGDTVEVNAVKIRLEAIDAPETEQLCASTNKASAGHVGSKCASSSRNTPVTNYGRATDMVPIALGES